MGRPPKAPDDRKKQTAVRLSLKQLRWLDVQAALEGLTRSDIVRRLVREAMKREEAPVR